jgi:hypothetical protein
MNDPACKMLLFFSLFLPPALNIFLTAAGLTSIECWRQGQQKFNEYKKKEHKTEYEYSEPLSNVRDTFVPRSIRVGRSYNIV